jgi:ABC-type glycerol-3-phosphate transport system substrate-binding protein
MKYDGKEMMDVYTKISDMNEKGYFGDDILSTDYALEKSTFTSGGSAMIWGLNSDVMGTLAASDVGFKVGVTAMPYGNESFKSETQGGVNNVWHVSTMNKSQEEIDASVYWVKWMTSDQSLSDYTKVIPNIFGREFDLDTDDPLMKEVLDIYGTMTKMKSDVQSYDDRTYLLDTVRNALQGIALGNSPEQCADEIITQIKSNE